MIATGRPFTLTWVDADTAHVARWADGRAEVRELTSDVPTHRRSTGSVRHDPMMRHGGGGQPQTAGEPHRNEHIRQWIAAVASAIDPLGDVEVIGPGAIPQHVADAITESDRVHGRRRAVTWQHADPVTHRQLVAELRARAGVPAPRVEKGKP